MYADMSWMHSPVMSSQTRPVEEVWWMPQQPHPQCDARPPTSNKTQRRTRTLRDFGAVCAGGYDSPATGEEMTTKSGMENASTFARMACRLDVTEG